MISSGGIASCEEILQTCDTLSATCNVFQSSSLRDKLQEKLPRVTWPLDNKIYSTLFLFTLVYKWLLAIIIRGGGGDLAMDLVASHPRRSVRADQGGVSFT